MAQGGQDVESGGSGGAAGRAPVNPRASLEVTLPQRPPSANDFYTPQATSSGSRADVFGNGAAASPAAASPSSEGVKRCQKASAPVWCGDLGRRCRVPTIIKRFWRRWAIGAVVLLFVYCFVPEMVIQMRLDAAPVNIREAILEVGGNDGAFSIQGTADFSVPRDVLQLPLVFYKAYVYGFDGRLYFHRTEEDRSVSKLLMGAFKSEDLVTIDSRKDAQIRAGGVLSVDRVDNIQLMIQDFVKNPNVTMSLEAVVNIHALVYGFIPASLFGVSISKALTVDAFNAFKGNPIKLQEMLEVHGSPGEASITATASIFNPTVVTMVMKEDFEMGIAFPNGEADLHPNLLGVMKVAAPMVVRPGNNTNKATVVVRPTEANEDDLQRFIGAYLGEQDGFMLAGERTPPLPVRVSDVSSGSPLVQAVAKGLEVVVPFGVMPMKFLSAISADVIALNDLRGYSVLVNLLITNPLPRLVKVKAVELHAHHPNLDGDKIYEYIREVGYPYMNPAHYKVEALETSTISFELSPTSEVTMKVATNLLGLLHQATHRAVTLGIDLKLTVEIGEGDGFVQMIHYKNKGLKGELCLNALPPRSPCGGLPKNDESIHPPVEDDWTEDPLFWT